MVAFADPGWNPTCIRRVAKTYPSGSEVVEVVSDAGPGFAKLLGNKEGPHVLACEWIGTRLAALLGLPVFDHAVFEYDGVPEIELASGCVAQSGPAWITRKEEGQVWSGEEEDLKLLANPEDLAGLVLLDTWILNCDRHCPAIQPTRINRNNVFLARRELSDDALTLVVMDHTHAFTCGRALTQKLAGIDRVKSDDIYGLFPEFQKWMKSQHMQAACDRLAGIPDNAIREVVDGTPDMWLEDLTLRETVEQFLTGRRDYLAPDLTTRIFPQTELF